LPDGAILPVRGTSGYSAARRSGLAKHPDCTCPDPPVDNGEFRCRRMVVGLKAPSRNTRYRWAPLARYQPEQRRWRRYEK
jgi:hypothetical protein